MMELSTVSHDQINPIAKRSFGHQVLFHTPSLSDGYGRLMS
ncbi:MAG: hypothetical protein OXF84_05445 [Bacteroidetes bacterium]|nr:hypothetical protein [Bacteroidota bacterium]